MRSILRFLMVTLFAAGCLYLFVSDAGSQICNHDPVSAVCSEDQIWNFETDYGGTPLGEIYLCDGSHGQGICTDGAGRIDAGDNDLCTRQRFEVACQARFSRLPGPGEFGSALVAKYLGQHPEESEFWLGVAGNDSRQWALCGDGQTCIFSQPGVVQEDTLYCVRGLWFEDYAEIWVNGELVASGNVSRNPNNTETPLVIAGSAGGDSQSPFFGMIDEVRFGCPLHDVQPICQDDLICHMDGDLCDGTVVGNVNVCPGVSGHGICMGGDGYIDMGNDDFFTRSCFELEATVIFSYLPGEGEFGSAIAGIYMGQLPGESEFWIGVGGNGSRQWMLAGDGITSIVSEAGRVEVDVPYHVRGIWCDSGAEIWVNDTLVAAGSVTRNPVDTSTPLTIGGTAGGDSHSPFFGMIDELRFGCPGHCVPHPIASICEEEFIWDFEDGLGGDPTGEIWLCDGAWGQGLCADGGGRIVVGDIDFESSAAIEIEAQVILTEIAGPGDFGNGIICAYQGQYPELSEFWLGVAGNGHRCWMLCGDGRTSIVSDENTVEEDVLYCVRALLLGEYGEIWVDGQLAASGHVSRNYDDTGTPLVIAGSAGGDSHSPFHGMIDEVRVGCVDWEIAGVSTEPVAALNSPRLLHVRPNPTTTGATISFDIHRPTQVRTMLFGVDGRRIKVLFEGNLSAGHHQIPWDGRDASGVQVPSGIYLVRADLGDTIAAAQLAVIR